jgi:hypothetical protein
MSWKSTGDVKKGERWRERNESREDGRERKRGPWRCRLKRVSGSRCSGREERRKRNMYEARKQSKEKAQETNVYLPRSTRGRARPKPHAPIDVRQTAPLADGEPNREGARVPRRQPAFEAGNVALGASGLEEKDGVSVDEGKGGDKGRRTQSARACRTKARCKR